MRKLVLPLTIMLVIIAAGCSNNGSAAEKNASGSDTVYTCLPCGYGCDTLTYAASGTCSHCNMQLVEKSTVKFGTVNPEDICSFVTQKGSGNVVLLDVRTAEEFNGTAPDKFGRLANAVNIPVQQLQQRMNEMEKFKNSEIVVYCSHSHRSPAASYMLTQNGFAKVTNMAYGMSEWNNRVTGTACSSKFYIKQ